MHGRKLAVHRLKKELSCCDLPTKNTRKSAENATESPLKCVFLPAGNDESKDNYYILADSHIKRVTR